MAVKKYIGTPVFKKFFFLACILLILNYDANAQTETYNYFYRVYFNDKGANEVVDYRSVDLLSDKAIVRRQKAGITVPDLRDVPVYKGYIDQIKELGFRLHTTSKWMNTALFKSESPADITILQNLPFVREIMVVKNLSGKGSTPDKFTVPVKKSDPSAFDNHIAMINGLSVHNSGFTGENVLVAVLDGGFAGSDSITSLNSLRSRNGIKGTHDFVRDSRFVYDYSGHGTAVLSILAGEIGGQIAGSAPGADYWLMITEDTDTEYPAEEDLWAAGAEFADSIGADIITSSLGYFIFDDQQMNYKNSEMDGNTTFVTRAADIAASKGILVVSSAGNERGNEWINIIAPSDGDSVLAVGAVDATGEIASFSSSGLSTVNRIKPDLVAQGVNVPLQTADNVLQRSSGTSYSCPVISGLCACLMQAVPLATNYDIIIALHNSSDRFQTPDLLYGYGIPDMVKVISQLQEMTVSRPGDGSAAYPNPLTTDITITFRDIPEKLTVEIYSSSGKLVYRKVYDSYISRSVKLDEFQKLPQGFYIIRLVTKENKFTHKAVKISN